MFKSIILGLTFLTLSSQSSFTKLFDLSNTRSSLRSIQSTSDGKLLSGFIDNKINLHGGIEAKREIEYYFMLNKTETLMNLKVNGNLMAVGYNTGSIEILQLPYAMPLKRLFNSPGRITQIEFLFAKSTLYLLSSSNSSSLLIWNYNTSTLHSELKLSKTRPITNFMVFDSSNILAVNSQSMFYVIRRVDEEFEVIRSYRISDSMVKSMVRGEGDNVVIGLANGNVVEINPFTLDISAYYFVSSTEISVVTSSSLFYITIDRIGNIGFCKRRSNIVIPVRGVHKSSGKAILVTSDTPKSITLATGAQDGTLIEWSPWRRILGDSSSKVNWKFCKDTWMWTANALECGSCWTHCDLIQVTCREFEFDFV